MFSREVPGTAYNVPFYSLGLIGYPLGHSLSPQIHTAALHTLNLQGEYKLYPIPPHPLPRSHWEMGARGEGFTIASLLARMRAGQIHGLNVTIPHKQNVIPLLDELTPTAQAIGAVNTIFRRDAALVGDNTDVDGFWADVQKLATSGQWVVDSGQKPSALILGAGGSARAIAYALLIRGWCVAIYARRIEQARELCEQFSMYRDQLSILSALQAPLATRCISLIVNTTPLGMSPQRDACPWPADLPFLENAALYDLVYNPPETLLVQRARTAGLPVQNGLGMLIEQAALAFEHWTGLDAPREAMIESVKEKKVYT